MNRILLVDDDTTFCLMLKTWLTKRGFQVEEAFSAEAALKKVQTDKNYDVVLTDLRLPDKDGIFLLKSIKAAYPGIQVILMTGYADIHTAVESIKAGAFDYVSKPVIPEEILKKIQEALGQKNVSSGKPAEKKSQVMPYIRGNSAEAEKLYEYIRLVAPTMMSVLITGESGSGKEYIARLIHAESKRKEAPFVAVDCGAIPKDLAASEFFGHVKGAFTGAVNDKTGYFVAASGGTIFLDEIGNLGYDVQVQLLRALQERKVRPVGSDRETAFDVRIISATNENLMKAVAEGNFREDLYHRLNEFSLRALSLRERKEDIPVFANYFLAASNEELGKDVTGFEEEVMRIFKNYSWPGNLREMRNVVRRATLLCQTGFISKADIPAELSRPAALAEPDDFALRREKNEADLIREALAKCNNNKSEAARLLKIDRKTLYNKMKLYSIE